MVCDATTYGMTPAPKHVELCEDHTEPEADESAEQRSRPRRRSL